MYQPPHFREDRPEELHALIRAQPLGSLVTAGPGGLMANPLPFLVDADAGDFGTLRAHLARANPQLRELATVDDCLVIFAGPDAYVTPSWYATKRETGKVVPTWNYVAVHAWGPPRLIDDPTWLRGFLDDLTAAHEAARPVPWAVTDAPPAFVAGQLKGIVGLEIPLRRLEGKWKMSQNRPAADQRGVIAGLAAEGNHGLTVAGIVAARTGQLAAPAVHDAGPATNSPDPA